MTRMAPYLILLSALSCSQLGLGVEDNDDAELNLLTLAALQSASGSNQFLRLHSSSDLTVSDSTLTAIPFDQIVTGDSALFSASAPTRITIPIAGTYQIGATAKWATNGTGYRQLHVTRNGDNTNRILHSLVAASGSGGVSNNVSGIYTFSSGDYIEVFLFQNSGGSLNALTSLPAGTNSVMYPSFWIHRVD